MIVKQTTKDNLKEDKTVIPAAKTYSKIVISSFLLSESIQSRIKILINNITLL